MRYLGYFNIPDKAVIDNDSLCSAFTCTLCLKHINVFNDFTQNGAVSLLHFAYYLLQLELMGICFGISAFLRKGSVGVGLGAAVMMYFLNLIANIADVAEFLKYITPFGYCEGADIISKGSLDLTLIIIGTVIGIIGIIIAFLKYTKKDIH